VVVTALAARGCATAVRRDREWVGRSTARFARRFGGAAGSLPAARGRQAAPVDAAGSSSRKGEVPAEIYSSGTYRTVYNTEEVEAGTLCSY
jgi:hypothetical protein